MKIFGLCTRFRLYEKTMWICSFTIYTHTQSSQNIPFILSQMLSILGKDIMLNRYISNCWAVNQTAVQAQAQAQAQFPQTKFEHRDN